MKIINNVPIDSANLPYFDEMNLIYSDKTGFLQLTKLKDPVTEPREEIFCRSVSDTIESLNLNFNKEYKDLYNFRYYIKQCNMYYAHNIIKMNDYNSEVLSTIYSYYPKMFFEHLDNGLSTNNINVYLEAFKQDSFKRFFYEKLSENRTLDIFRDFLKSYSEKKESYLGGKKFSYNFITMNEFYNVIDNIRGIYEEGFKKIDSGEKYYNAELFFQMNEKEQRDWLATYNTQMQVYNLNVFSETFNINKKLGINLFNPETDTIKYIGDKYKAITDTILQDDKYCRLLKTVIYGALYVFKDKSPSFEPIKHINNLLGVNSSWAVGTERTKDPSFYGNSDFGKYFYGYAPYMTGDRNPYHEIINNKTVDRMDREAIKIHRYFRNNGIADYLYDLVFEKDMVGGKSLYEAIHAVRDLIVIIESPIVVGSLTNMAISVFQGIVSSIINSAVSAIDASLSYSMKQLFYVEFIPIGGKKHSLKDLYNYAVFLKLILQNYENLSSVEMIDKEDFIRKAYNVVGISERRLEEIGYFAYCRLLNAKEPSYFNYENDLLKKDKLVITCDQDFKVFYTILQFAKQKYLAEYGREYQGNMGNRGVINSLIRTLSQQEIFFCMDLYNINFYKLNDKFEKYSLEEYYDFNDDLMDVQHLYDLSSSSTALYNIYKNTDKLKLQIKMEQNLFKEVRFSKLIYHFIKHYISIVKKNKENIEKSIFDKNGISDIDDFLMRFLPSICELAKTLGFNDIGISTIIKILDYFCYFISDLLFKEYFFKIKNMINDQLKMFSENMFKSLDKFKTDEVLVKFDVGGSLIVNKLDGILKLLEDGVLFSTVLNECFKDENYINGDLDGEDFYYNDYEYEDFEYEFKDNEDIIIEKVDKEEDKGGGIIITPTYPGGGSIDDIIVDKVKKPIIDINKEEDIVITKPDGGGSIDKDKDVDKDKDDNKTVDEIIKIKDKIESIKNKEINKIINKVIQLEKEIENELNKVRPTYPIIKDKKEEVKKLNEELSKLKNKVTTPYDKDWKDNRENAIISNFINNELDFEKANNILDELNKIVYENDLVLTNHEIIRLLK
ncbi:hypothetical protein [Cetobacterium sp.]|uniref:hypothetical protein n=1 Tax=Cetobacterium sp. TaxID=2071632 RepID=UPI003F326F47